MTSAETLALESRERLQAIRRAEMRERERASGTLPDRGAYTGFARPFVASRAFAALAENVRDFAIFLLNPHGVITFWGEGARLMKWWTKDQAEGAHLRMLYPDGGSDDGTAEEHLVRAAESGEYTGEGLRVRNDGSTFWAGVTLTALRDTNGTLIGFAKVTRDLTARRAAEALMRSAAESAESARAAAESANAAKSGFLATISHEIRTPVNAILGYHQLLELELDGPLSPGQRDHLARASASGRHLLTLITEILDFSKLEAGQAWIKPVSFKVCDVVDDAIGLVTPQARDRQLEVIDAVNDEGELHAYGDESSARQVVLNLLSNAVKFTESREGQAGRITVSAGVAESPAPEARATGPGPWVYVRVEDTGIGIPPGQTEAMFEPFIQADMTLTRRAGGTGLGLAICRRLARLMHGDVTVHSEPGVGSSFVLWLPAAPFGQRAGESKFVAEGGDRARQGMTEVAQVVDRRTPPDGAQRIGASNAGDAASGMLRSIANAVLAEIERVLHSYVARLRSDPLVPSARTLSEPQLEDHLASYLADLASTLTGLDLSSEEPKASLRDSSAIQRVVSRQHGLQRARLGWDVEEIRREFQIVREELIAAIRRRAPHLMRGPEEGREHELERAVDLLHAFIDSAERISLASYAEARTGNAVHEESAAT